MKLLKFILLLIITCIAFALFCHFIPTMNEHIKWILLGLLIVNCIRLADKSKQSKDADLYED